jgi:phosphoribosyl-AMP cyclohydrolase
MHLSPIVSPPLQKIENRATTNGHDASMFCGGRQRMARLQHKNMADDRETGLMLDPKYDAAGLITAVVTDLASGTVLMVAHMNAAALDETRSTGEATFFSRSRGRLWKKGETSGNIMRVVEIRIDCDQDAVWLIVDPAGPACHTGAASCFYRRIDESGLAPVQ